MILKSLKARSIRGIPAGWTDLGIGQNGLVIYGPNGVGKTSIVDAIEFSIRNETDLYPVNRQGVTWETGSPHVLGGDREVSITVSSDGGREFAVGPASEPNDLAKDEQGWITAARGASFVLRRHMLLRFILENPRERYGLLEPFMNLGPYRGVEDGLKNLADSLQARHEAADARVTSLDAGIRQVFEFEAGTGLDEAAVLAGLNGALDLLEHPRAETLDGLEDIQRRIAEELGGEALSDTLSNLASVRAHAQRLGQASALDTLLDGLAESIEALDREIQHRTEELLTDFLVLGKEAIETAGLESCPLCEQDIDREELVARLQERIELDSRITAARQLIDERRDELKAQLQALAQPFSLFIGEWENNIQRELPDIYRQTNGLLTELGERLQQDTIRADETREFRSRLAAGISDHTEIITMIDDLIRDAGGGDRRVTITKAASMIETLLTEWPMLLAARLSANAIHVRQRTTASIHGHAVEARKSALRETLGEVSVDANRFYEAIHPGENIGGSTLSIRDAGNSSVELRSRFNGTREHPLLHYSESHLDTLGLCFFLALRRHEASKNPLFKVLVLDDVMHSVDAAHRVRIAKLIKDEFADHQVIITTHDDHFFAALRRELGNNGFSYQRINNWDLERGPVLGDPLTDFDRIMDPANREQLSTEVLTSTGGRFFEWLLQEVSESLAVAIPARFKRNHDIGSLWPSCAARLKRQAGYFAEHSAAIDALESNSWVRNACGAHYNETSAPPTPEEARSYAEGLAALYDSLYCGDCREFISRQSDESWQCSGGHINHSKSTPQNDNAVPA